MLVCGLVFILRVCRAIEGIKAFPMPIAGCSVAGLSLETKLCLYLKHVDGNYQSSVRCK